MDNAFEYDETITDLFLYLFPFLDFLFNFNSPSMIAAAAICATFQNLRHQFGSLCPTNYELIQILTEITGVDEVNSPL